MVSPEADRNPRDGLYDIPSVVSALEALDQEDYALAITAVEDVIKARRAKGYGDDLQYARLLLRPQMPPEAKEHFEIGYRVLNALHEEELAGMAERTNAFLLSHPGVLVYTSPEAGEQRAVTRLAVKGPDSVYRIARLSVVYDTDEQWLKSRGDTLNCDIYALEPELQVALEPLLNPNEAE